MKLFLFFLLVMTAAAAVTTEYAQVQNGVVQNVIVSDAAHLPPGAWVLTDGTVSIGWCYDASTGLFSAPYSTGTMVVQFSTFSAVVPHSYPRTCP